MDRNDFMRRIMCLSKYWRDAMRNETDEHGTSERYHWVLQALSHEDGMTQREIAQKIQRAPASISLSIHHLEQDGFVHSEPDEADGRCSRIFLTDKGRRNEEINRALADGIGVSFTAGLSDEEINEAGRMLDVMIETARNREKRNKNEDL